MITNGDKKRKAGFFAACILTLFLLYLPCFLTFHPGNISTDTFVSLQQAAGNSAWTNHHPVLFTLFLKVVYVICGWFSMNMNQAVAVMTLLQLMFWVCALAGVFYWVWQQTESKVLRIACGLFLGCNPILMLYGVELGKDTFFSGWLIWYCILIAGLLKNSEKLSVKHWVCFGLVSVMLMFSRSNGSLIVLFTGLCLLAAFKKSRKPLAALLGTQLVLLLFVQKLLFPALDIRGSSFAEAATVPIQQLAYTLKEEGNFKEESLQYLDSIMPLQDWQEKYNPVITDTIKFADSFQDVRLNETKGEFLKVWLDGLLSNPGKYVKAYLMHIQGYWDIRSIANVSNLQIEENNLGIAGVDFVEMAVGFSLRSLYYYGMQAFRKLPLWRYHMSEAVLAVLLVATAIRLAIGKRKYFFCILPLLFCLATLFIAAPLATQFRYFLPIYALYPMLLVCGLCKDKKKLPDIQ